MKIATLAWNTPVRPSWDDLFAKSRHGAVLEVYPTDLVARKFGLSGTFQWASKRFGVSDDILFRFLRVCRYPEKYATQASRGVPNGNFDDEMQIHSCLERELSLFSLLASSLNAGTAVLDHQIYDDVQTISRWVNKANLAWWESPPRVRRAFSRVKTAALKASVNGRSELVEGVLLGLADRHWRIFREATRLEGAIPFRQHPIDPAVFAECLNILIAQQPNTAHDEWLRKKWLSTRQQLPWLFRHEPLDHREHWMGLGSETTNLVEHIARKKDFQLWRGYKTDPDEIIRVLNSDFIRAPGSEEEEALIRSARAKREPVHLCYKVLIGMYVHYTQVLPDFTESGRRARGAVVDFMKRALSSCKDATGKSLPFADHYALIALNEWRYRSNADQRRRMRQVRSGRVASMLHQANRSLVRVSFR